MPRPAESRDRERLEDRAQRIRARLRGDPSIEETIRKSQEDEREGRFVSHEEIVRKHRIKE